MTQGVFHTRSCYYAGRVPPHFLPDRRPPSILQSGGMNLTRRGDGKSGLHRTLTGLVICLVCLTIPATAAAKPYKLVTEASESGSYIASAFASGTARRPARIKLQVDATHPVNSGGSFDISCSTKDFDFNSRSYDLSGLTVPFTRTYKPTVKNAKECDVSVFLDVGSLEPDEPINPSLHVRIYARKR